MKNVSLLLVNIEEKYVVTIVAEYTWNFNVTYKSWKLAIFLSHL